jgi:hypothetical protein
MAQEEHWTTTRRQHSVCAQSCPELPNPDTHMPAAPSMLYAPSVQKNNFCVIMVRSPSTPVLGILNVDLGISEHKVSGIRTPKQCMMMTTHPNGPRHTHPRLWRQSNLAPS